MKKLLLGILFGGIVVTGFTFTAGTTLPVLAPIQASALGSDAVTQATDSSKGSNYDSTTTTAISVQTQVKPAVQPAIKTDVKPALKPVVKPTAQTAAKPAATTQKPVVKPVTPAVAKQPVVEKNHQDGIYRGVFVDGNEIQVGVEFELKNNLVSSIKFRHLLYKGKDYRSEKEDVKVMELNKQYQTLITSLVGKDIRTAVKTLYAPGNIVTVSGIDGLTGATLRSGKLVSAINDALNRGPYAMVIVTETAKPTDAAKPAIAIDKSLTKSHEDGTYRGVFIDGNEIQVNLEFELKNNLVQSIKFRHLAYKGKDYRNEKEDSKVMGIAKQYNDLIAYLIGKDIRVALKDLYAPGNVVKDPTVDGMTGATLRSGKMVSAINDALNRGLYSYPKK